MKSVEIIIPTYNLSGDRFDNFCFIIRKLSESLHLCNVCVVEQTSNTNIIQSFLQKFPKIKHLSVVADNVFNKSKLINYATTRSDADFIWMLDGDFYSDYNYILESSSEYADFVRPFGKTISLDEKETELLLTSGYVVMNREKYITNESDGKFSFIVNREVFLNSQMMNENYIGWGFQDLDFVENRLIACSKSNIDVSGFHMYHKPASKKYVNRNKRLYLNVNLDEKLPTEKITTETLAKVKPKYLKSPTHDKVDVKQSKTSYTASKKSNVLQAKNNLSDIITNHSPSKGDITHIHYKNWVNTNMFPSDKNIFIIDESRRYTTRRSSLNKIKSIKKSSHFTLAYLEYIIKNYDNLSELCIFSTDLFSNSPTKFTTEDIRRIERCSEIGMDNSMKMMWLSSTKPLKLIAGHSDLAVHKSKYKFNRWVELYTQTKPKQRSKYSLAGAFAVDSKIIKKHPVEYYIRIHNQTPTWVEEDYLFFMASFQNIFA